MLQEAGLEAEAGLDEAGLTSAAAWVEGTEPGQEEPRAPTAEAPPNLRRIGISTAEEGPPTNAAIYFRDISAVTLLSAEQEIELAQQIEAGEDARRELRAHPHMAEERREHLEDVSAIGEQSRSRLTEANLRLVVSVAR